MLPLNGLPFYSIIIDIIEMLKKYLSNRCLDMLYPDISKTYEEILEAKLTVNSNIESDYIEDYIINSRRNSKNNVLFMIIL